MPAAPPSRLKRKMYLPPHDAASDSRRGMEHLTAERKRTPCSFFVQKVFFEIDSAKER